MASIQRVGSLYARRTRCVGEFKPIDVGSPIETLKESVRTASNVTVFLTSALTWSGLQPNVAGPLILQGHTTKAQTS